MKLTYKKFLAATLVAALMLGTSFYGVPAFAAGEGSHVSASTGQTISEDECQCFDVEGIKYAPLTETTVAVVNPVMHPVTGAVDSTYSGEITIPATVAHDSKTYTVTKIDNRAFANSGQDSETRIAITSISLPNTIAEIGEGAFENCAQLSSLTIPSSVTKIGANAFGGCKSLTNLEIPAGVTDGIEDIFGLSTATPYPNVDSVTFAPGSPYKIVTGVLYKKDTLIYLVDDDMENVTIPSGVTEIPDNAFSGSKIKSIDLSDVTKIGAFAFKDCSSLENVIWPNNLESMGTSAFSDCSSLKSVDIKGSIATIPTSAFEGCIALETVSLSDGVEKIESLAFNLMDTNSPSLKVINIPESVASLGAGFLVNVKDNETLLIFEGDVLPTFEESEGIGALSGISGEEMNKPIVYYPASAANIYTASSSALVTAGLVSANDSHGYALPEVQDSYSVEEGSVLNIGSYTCPTDAKIDVQSSDTTKVTVSATDGTITVTGVSAGAATITAKITVNNVTIAEETYTVNVTPKPVPATGITLDRDSLSLYSNSSPSSATLTATVTPENSTDTVTWTSDDPTVATVDANGVVTAVGNGTAIITATAGDYSATCDVRVSTYVAPSTPDPSPTPTPEPEPETPAVSTDDNAGTTETTAKPDVTVSGGTASATVSDEMGEEIVNQATENDSATVIIAPEMDDDVTSTEVTLPSATVDSIGTDTNADIVISTPVADVTLPNGGLSDLASAGGDITVSASVDGNTVQFSVTANGEPVTEVTGGVTLVVPASDTTAGTVAVIVYDDGTREVVRKSVAGDDSVTIPLSGSATIEIVDNSKDFDDVSAGAWYSDVVDFASSHELFNGTSATTFSPNDAMTRGMLAAVLANLESADVSGMQSAFNDVHDEEWYSESVAWAAENGIVNGYGDGAFGPNDAITREQLAAMLYNYADMLGLDTTARVSLAGYNDQPSAWATDVMQWAVAEGLITGTSSDTLDPQGTATRAQVAAMLQRFIENVL